MLKGLYFGSFDPIHIGHVAIANFMIELTKLDEIWFVVSPQSPLKKACAAKRSISFEDGEISQDPGLEEDIEKYKEQKILNLYIHSEWKSHPVE